MTRKPKTLRRVRFTVEGHGDFPDDMLRYDGCHPLDREDRERIDEHKWTPGCTRDSKPYTVNLEKFVPAWWRRDFISAGHYPTNLRWRSFGWEVIKVQSVVRLPFKDVPLVYVPRAYKE